MIEFETFVKEIRDPDARCSACEYYFGPDGVCSERCRKRRSEE